MCHALILTFTSKQFVFVMVVRGAMLGTSDAIPSLLLRPSPGHREVGDTITGPIVILIPRGVGADNSFALSIRASLDF